MKAYSCVLVALAFGCACLRSQDDDKVELSPFVVANSDAGYFATNAPVPPKPNVAITLRKPATSVTMEVNLVNSADKPEVRNRDIYATVTGLEQAVRNTPGLKFERREIQLRGDAKLSSFLRSGKVSSTATCAVVAPLAADADVFALVQKMRTLVASVTPAGATKILDGTVGLVLDRPEQYRPELLKKIFDDIAFVRSGVGPDFEVLPTGLAGAVKMRAASEKELELWIDYGFEIRSVLQFKNPAPAKG